MGYLSHKPDCNIHMQMVGGHCESVCDSGAVTRPPFADRYVKTPARKPAVQHSDTFRAIFAHRT
jgi:hypothetical protein